MPSLSLMLHYPIRLLFRCLRMTALLSAVWGGAPGGLSLAAAAPVEMDVSRDAGRVDLRIRTTVEAPRAVIWAVLTDYGNTARWVPGMASSDVLERMGDGAIVEQSGYATVLFFHLAVHSVVRVTELPPDRIEVGLVKGDFKYLKGAYVIRALDNADARYELVWHGQLELASQVPGFVAQPLLANNLKDSFEGLVGEVERRAKIARSSK
jgi:ribosome-associated toxin RatA of RatAB toxin-antitoxin module